jgi:hypothetical protein
MAGEFVPDVGLLMVYERTVTVCLSSGSSGMMERLYPIINRIIIYSTFASLNI